MNKKNNCFKNIYQRYGEVIRYLVIGVLTTILSLVIKYALLFTILDAKDGFELQIAVVTSWICSVIFAYVTNRLFVFASKSKNIIKEMFLFFSSRVTTLLLESFILWFFITHLKLDSDGYVVLWTLVSQVLVIIGNYILSKFIVFNQDSQNSKKVPYFAILFFIGVVVLAYIFPYTHDDWDWGGAEGMRRLNVFFSNFNGRYAGNLFVIFLTRFRLLRALIIAGSGFSLVYFARKIVSFKNRYLPWLMVILLLAMPKNIFMQSIAWTAGFANYVVPVLCAFIALYINRNLFTKQTKSSAMFIVGFFLLGTISCLFIEHMSVYMVISACFFVGYGYIRYHSFSWTNVSYFIGTVFGCFLMFGTNAIRQGGYRSISFQDIFQTYFQKFYQLLVANSWILNSILILLLLVLIYQFYQKKKETLSMTTKGGLLLLSSFQLFYFIFDVGKHFIWKQLSPYVGGVLALFYGITFTILICIVVQNKNVRNRILFEIASICVIAAPLLVVKPIGPRCFFDTYLFFVLIGMELLNLIDIPYRRILHNGLLLMATILLGRLLWNYYGVYTIEQERQNYIESHLQEEVLYLPKIGKTKWAWNADPQSDWFIEKFHEFYHIPLDTELIFIDYQDWKETIAKRS